MHLGSGSVEKSLDIFKPLLDTILDNLLEVALCEQRSWAR